MYAVIEYVSGEGDSSVETCICGVWVKRTIKSAEKLALKLLNDQYLDGDDGLYGYPTKKDGREYLKQVMKGLAKKGQVSVGNWFVQIKEISTI